MTTEREPLPDATRPDAQPADASTSEPLNEAQRRWDAQMAEARRYYSGPLKPMHPRPMTREEAKAWLSESQRIYRQGRWKPWPPTNTATSE